MDAILLRAAHLYLRTDGPDAPPLDLDASGIGTGNGGRRFVVLLSPLTPGVAVEVRAVYRITIEGTLRRLSRLPHDAVAEVVACAVEAAARQRGHGRQPERAERAA